MKKLISIIAILMATVTFVSAQNTTRIGSAHNVNFGGYYGYGQGSLHNYGAAFIDINAAKSNLRTRIQLGEVQRWDNPFAAVAFQYLFPVVGGLYIYPFAGLEGEMHKDCGWEKDYDFSPEAGAGLEYQFCSNFGIFVQGRYQYMLNEAASRLSGNAGVVFAFGKGKRALAAEAAALAAAEAAAAEAAAKAAAAKAAAEKAAAEKAAAERAAAEKAAAEKAAAEKAAAERAAAERAAARAITEEVLFNIGKHNLDEGDKAQIAHVVEILNTYPEALVAISAYADKETGTAKGNMKLSEKRAAVVVNALKDAGIAEDRITSAFYGSEINPYPTPEQNRVSVVVTR